LRRLVASEGKTIIVSSHLLHDIEAACDRVALLRAGRLIVCEPMEDLLRVAAGGSRRVRFGFAAENVASRARAHLLSRGAADADAAETGEVETGRTIAPGGFELEVTVGADPAGAIAATLDHLSAVGCTPFAVVPVRPTLKDLFLQLTGAGAPPTAPPTALRPQSCES
jgi:ABC-type multidrug transport system ATPase subunit